MAESITCPKCRMTSHNANDIKYGYCGNCHEYTGVAAIDMGVGTRCSACGLLDPFHEKDCPTLREHQEELAQEFGDEHPSLQAVREDSVDLTLVQPRVEPRPGEPEWADWSALFEVIISAPYAVPRNKSFAARRELALHLWQHGYRRPVQDC